MNPNISKQQVKTLLLVVTFLSLVIVILTVNNAIFHGSQFQSRSLTFPLLARLVSKIYKRSVPVGSRKVQTLDIRRDELNSSPLTSTASTSSNSLPTWAVIVISVLCSFIGFVILVILCVIFRQKLRQWLLKCKAGSLFLASKCWCWSKFLGNSMAQGIIYCVCCKCCRCQCPRKPKKAELNLSEIPQVKKDNSHGFHPNNDLPTPPGSSIPPDGSPTHTLAPLPDPDPNPLPGTMASTMKDPLPQVMRPNSTSFTSQPPALPLVAVNARETLSQIHSNLWPRIHENVTSSPMARHVGGRSLSPEISTSQLSAVDWVLQLPNALMSTYTTFPPPATQSNFSNYAAVYEDPRVRRLGERPVSVMDLPTTGLYRSESAQPK